ncbi:MAG TPA: dTDP-4-dehydrorhamnose 3,5-epimerase [Deltaproteobacteria bacterium]|nr:dTDP-4-dehydrorhamnose 3,5-epimerase [Deltaproteobacteria bacterium]
MKFVEMELPGAFVVEPAVHKDTRGFFVETFNEKEFRDNGIMADFVQDNYSFSRHQGVLRGLHFQYPPYAQAKLVLVISGSVYDVIVDLRKDSPTFRRWISVELRSSELNMIYVPRGFAHGFCTLEDNTHVLYKVDSLYAPSADGGIRWDDPDLSISWPATSPLLSEKDSRLPYLKDITL